MRLGKRKAFTMTELIVVLAIVVLLAAIGWMAYQTITRNAEMGAKASGADAVKTVYQAHLTFEQAQLGLGIFDLDGANQWGNGAVAPIFVGEPSPCEDAVPPADAYWCDNYNPAIAADISSVGQSIRDTGSFVTVDPYWTDPFEVVEPGDMILFIAYLDGTDCVVSFGPATGGGAALNVNPSASECVRR